MELFGLHSVDFLSKMYWGILNNNIVCNYCSKGVGIGVSASICHQCLVEVSVTASFYESYLGSDWVESDSVYYRDKIKDKGYLSLNWVYDKSHSVFCFFDSGSHIFAIRFILSKFYGISVFDRGATEEIRGIISDNLVVYNCSIDGLDNISDIVLFD